jgi:hypothetical protein
MCIGNPFRWDGDVTFFDLVVFAVNSGNEMQIYFLVEAIKSDKNIFIAFHRDYQYAEFKIKCMLVANDKVLELFFQI